MNLRKIIASAMVGAAMMLSAFVGTGAAASTDVNINVYGSSAMYLYWNASAPGILNSMGCTNITQAKYDANDAISMGTCGADNHNVYIRVTSKASFDGIESLLNNDQYAATGYEKCTSNEPSYPGASLEGFYRNMVDETSCTWGTGNVFSPSYVPGSCSALKCERVTLGCSDVAGQSFTQESHGLLKGPMGGPWTDRKFTGINPVGSLF